MAKRYYTKFSQVEKNRRYKQKLRDIRNGATALAKEKMRDIVTRDKILYNSLFAFPVLKVFAKKKELTPQAMIMVMLMDLYPIFTCEEAKVWGIYSREDNFTILHRTLSEKGYMFLDGHGRGRKYYLSLKGKLLVKEFNKDYDDQVRKIFKQAGNKKQEVHRKITRIKVARKHKPRNQPASGQPSVDSEGGDTGSNDRPEGLGQHLENGGNNA